MKQALAFSCCLAFICAVLLPTGGGLARLVSQQQQWKKEVKRSLMKQIPKQQLKRLEFSFSDIAKLDWKHAGEFKFEGDYYDVVSRDSLKHSVVFWCFHDEIENTFEDKIHAVVAEKLKHNKEHSDYWEEVAAFEIVYYQPDCQLSFSSFIENNSTISYCSQQFNFKSIQQELDGPPPKQQPHFIV